MTYKFEIGQRVIDMDLRECTVTSRFTGLSGRYYIVRVDDCTTQYTREIHERELMKVVTPKPKYERGEWVAHRLYGAGYVEVAGSDLRYRIYVPGLGERCNLPEDQLTKIEHDIRSGDRVTFKGWAELCGDYTVTGKVTKLTSHEGLDIRCDKTNGIYSRSADQVTKLAKPIPKSDLPMPPKFDTLRTTKTITTTFTNVDPELFKLLTGTNYPEPTKRIKEAREALDKQIKDAEAELAKLKEARGKL
jgi:hypothetical protein